MVRDAEDVESVQTVELYECTRRQCPVTPRRVGVELAEGGA
jgi:hypothetical protein